MKTDIVLTNSEWRIMRVLWEVPYLTSGEVCFEVKKERELSVTTVKTQITSLLQKGVIKADNKERYPRYYPVITELEIVHNSIDDLVQKFYGEKVQYESKHFIFYGTEDKDFLRNLSLKAEELFHKVRTFLGLTEEFRTKVYFYRTHKRLSSSYGELESSELIKTAYNHGIVHLAPRDMMSHEEAYGNFSFSFIQVVLLKTTPNVPYYIRQGLCGYLGGYLSENSYITTLKDRYKSLTFEDVLKLYGGKDVYESMSEYYLSTSFVTFLIKIYGRDLMIDFLFEKQPMLIFLFQNQIEIVKQWKRYIEHRLEESL